MMNDHKKYIDYVNTHAKEIAKYVNACFDSEKESIKEEIIETIQAYLKPIPIHYKWVDDGCPYDHSGDIVKDGRIDLNQTVMDFLEGEYTGDKRAVEHIV